MLVCKGFSESKDSATAIREATKNWDRTVEMIFIFCSPEHDLTEVCSFLKQYYPNAKSVGCTTAGELLDDMHFNKSLVAVGISSNEMKWSIGVLDDVKHLTEADVVQMSHQMFEELGIDSTDYPADRLFMLSLIDGLSGKEEKVSELAAEIFDGITILGGSSGDDLQFKRTNLFANCKMYTNAAIFVMAKTDLDFVVIKHQHFLKSPKSIVVTKADPDRRVVHEFDGHPANIGLAKVLGISPDKLTSEVAFLKPLAFVCDGTPYVRSIQQILPDGSISFYCGIEEGMVLNLLEHNPMTDALELDIANSLGGHRFSFFLGFNCILRSLEAKNNDCHKNLGMILRRHFDTIAGFDTYGEQLNGLHINQTLVGIAIRKVA